MKSIIAIALLIVILFVTGSLQQNYDFDNAETIQTLPGTIAIDNTLSSGTELLNLCGDLEFATSFLWYKIEPTNSLRIFTFSTCNSEFDTVIGAFTGTSFATLESLGCHDDQQYGHPDSCPKGGSVLEDIHVNAGETLYLVIGGSTYAAVSQGTGTLTITLVDPSDAGCSSELILQVKQDLQSALTSSTTDIEAAIASSEDDLQTAISASQTVITGAISTSESTLSTSIEGVQVAVDVIDGVLDTTAATVSSISTLMDTVNSNVATLQIELTAVDGAVDELGSDLTSLSSSVTSQFAVSNAMIDSLQTTATAISSSSDDLLASANAINSANANLLTDLTSFHGAVSTSFNDVNDALSSVDTQITNVDTAITSIETNLGEVDESLTTLSTSLNTFTANLESSFSSANTNVDELELVATQVKADVDQILVDGATIQEQQSDIALQLSDFEESVDSKFAELNTELENANTAVISLQSSTQSSFADRTTQLTSLESSSDVIRSNTEEAVSTLSAMRTGVDENTQDAVFIDTLIRYLPDRSNTNPPLSLRMPNAYGGQLNDAADWVASQYGNLKTAALLIGTKGSAECDADQFCKFFLGTADAAYSDSIAKFTFNLNARKLRTAYSYLQQAFINLYPSTW